MFSFSANRNVNNTFFPITDVAMGCNKCSNALLKRTTSNFWLQDGGKECFWKAWKF